MLSHNFSEFIDRRLALCSFLYGFTLSLLTMSGYSLSNYRDLNLLYTHTLFFWISVLILTIVYSCIFVLLANIIHRTSIGKQLPYVPFHLLAKNIIPKLFLLYCLAWLPYLVIHLPGTITFDVYFQMMQTDGLGPFTTHHPPFTTWLYGLFWSLGDVLGSRNYGLFTFSFLQILLTAFAFSFMFCYLRYVRIPTVVRRVLLLFTVLCPLFPLAAECMTKDYSFGLVWIFWIIGFIESIRTKGALLQNKKFAWIFFVCSFLLILTKKPGIYIISLSALASIVFLKRSSIKLILPSFGAIIAYIILFQCIIFPSNGITESNDNDMLSLPLQQTARYVSYYSDSIPENEQSAINQVLPYNDLANLYDPTLSDPVKAQFNSNASWNDKKNYAIVWFKEFTNHPIAYLEATGMNTFELFYPCTVLDQFEDIPDYWRNDQSLVNYFKSNDAYETTSENQISDLLNSLNSSEKLSAIRKELNGMINRVITFPIIGFFCSQAFFAFWLPFTALIYTLYRRSWKTFIMLVPVLLSVLVLFASPVVQSRYITPLFYISPILVSLPFLIELPNIRTPHLQK